MGQFGFRLAFKAPNSVKSSLSFPHRLVLQRIAILMPFQPSPLPNSLSHEIGMQSLMG